MILTQTVLGLVFLGHAGASWSVPLLAWYRLLGATVEPNGQAEPDANLSGAAA